MSINIERTWDDVVREKETQRIRANQQKFEIMNLVIRCPICWVIRSLEDIKVIPPPDWASSLPGTVRCQCGYEAEIEKLGW